MIEHPGWKRMSFKGNKVWVSVDDKDRPILTKGKALIKYNLEQNYEYFIQPAGLKPDSPENLIKKSKQGKSRHNSSTDINRDTPVSQKNISHHEEGVIHVFTDGASSGNPGPSGIGVFFRYGTHEREISRYIGEATNNIAELEAIHVALKEITKPELPVRIYTDSSYASGLLVKNHKAQKNKELVESIRLLMKRFKNLSIIKVEGHKGVEGNERADKLATSAVSKRNK